MLSKKLVPYGSRFGSTAGAAEAIRKTLKELVAQVEVMPVQEVKDVSVYQAIIAGSAINGGVWLLESHHSATG